MAEEITLKDLMLEIKTIKKLVLKDLQIDTEDMDLDRKEIRMNKKSFEESKKIFRDIEEWKAHIWDECLNRKTISKKGEFDYDCELLKGPCKFEHCPLNIKREAKSLKPT